MKRADSAALDLAEPLENIRVGSEFEIEGAVRSVCNGPRASASNTTVRATALDAQENDPLISPMRWRC
jgi:hypothetical protein